MPYLDYSGGTSLEDLMMRKLGEGQYATAAPTVSPELSAFGAQAGTAKPEPTTGEKLMKGLQDLSPLISQVGTSLMRGRNTVTGAPTETVGSQIGGALTSALGTVKMNEALKKMIAQQLSGGGGGGVGGGTGFSEGQPVGFTGAETVGLTPEQVSGLYSTGLGLREKELKRPFENMQALSESYLKIMTGEAKPAEIALHNATAQKTLAELAKWDANSWQEWQAKEAAIKKIIAETAEVNAKTEAIPTETARKVAETKLKIAEEKKITQELDPAFVARKKRLETMLGTKLTEVDTGTEKLLINPITAEVVDRFKVEAKPESTSKIKGEVQRDITFAAGQIAPWIVPIIESNLATTKEKQQMQNLGQLLALMKPVGGGEIDVKAVKALAARIPGLANKFDRAIDAYMTSGGNESFKGQLVRSIFSEGMTPVASEKSTTGKPVTEKYKPGAAATTPPPVAEFTAQLQGKPAKVYESGLWRVKWDGKTIISIEPKKSTSEELYNFGTYY